MNACDEPDDAVAMCEAPLGAPPPACVAMQVDIDEGCTVNPYGVCVELDDGSITCNSVFPMDVGNPCGDGSCTCVGGVCMDGDGLANVLCDIPDAGTGGDPHMIGFRGQKIDWKGKDGRWYVLLSDTADLQMSVRLTAPLPKDFPDRQLITGVGIRYHNEHSIVIVIDKPYTTETEGCPESWNQPCLSEKALKITVDGEEHLPVSALRVPLSGGASMTASNLPTECQPYGGDVAWANTFTDMADHRRLIDEQDLDEWVLGWSASTAVPSWCEQFVAENGSDGLLGLRSKHAVFNIETPSLSLRLHHGVNHQGGEVLDDGRTLPELEFWQMDVHVEWFNPTDNSVTGILGETMHPVLDEAGNAIMSGADALRGEVEDYRVSDPLVAFMNPSH